MMMMMMMMMMMKRTPVDLYECTDWKVQAACRTMFT
jgi:hypothetical protein